LNEQPSLAIIGAGPAGLTACLQAVTHGIRPVVLEKGDQVGGIARTVEHGGYRFDIGGHRYFTKVSEVNELWHQMMGPDLLQVSRLSRIFYRGRFFHYPLELPNTLVNLGVVESARILASYLQAKLRPHRPEHNLEEWVVNRFGRRLYQMFFRTYTEKVWGIPCREIQADWADQRIRGLSLTAVVANALFRNNGAKSLIGEFHYPVLGPGMMWQRFQEVSVAQGAEVWLSANVVRVVRQEDQVVQVDVRRNGATSTLAAQHYISSMPLTELVEKLDPEPPREVLEAARSLRYRDFVLVGLIVDRPQLFPDNWIYVHSPEVKVGRIQNPKNWSSAMVPDPSKTSLGMEYFSSQGDHVWLMADDDLVQLAARELEWLGLAPAGVVEDGFVIRQSQTYPVYDPEYRERVDIIRSFLATLKNLQTIGRNGMHRYNNMDHSMLTAMLAVRNILGEQHDLWSVNTEPSYHEDAAGPVGD